MGLNLLKLELIITFLCWYSEYEVCNDEDEIHYNSLWIFGNWRMSWSCPAGMMGKVKGSVCMLWLCLRVSFPQKVLHLMAFFFLSQSVSISLSLLPPLSLLCPFSPISISLCLYWSQWLLEVNGWGGAPTVLSVCSLSTPALPAGPITDQSLGRIKFSSLMRYCTTERQGDRMFNMLAWHYTACKTGIPLSYYIFNFLLYFYTVFNFFTVLRQVRSVGREMKSEG